MSSAAPESSRGRTGPRGRWRSVLVVAAILALVAAIAVMALLDGGRRSAAASTEVVAVERSDQVTTVLLSGTLSPREQANASFAVPGTVNSVAVQVGQEVAVGEALATVDDRDLRNAVSLAEANLSAARAQVQTIRDADSATSAQLAAANAQVEAMAASVENARQRLADAVLTSPLAGVVAQVDLEVGDQVSGSGGSLGSLGSASGSGALGGIDLPSGVTGAASAGSGAQIVVVVPDAWQLEAEVGTADLPSLAPGQPAVVTPSGTDTHVTAVVDTVGIVATNATGSAAAFPVTVAITQPGVTLFSGSDADAVVTTATVPDVLTVPAEAVTHAADGSATVRRADDTTQTVTPGRRFGDRLEITEGLAAGDEVLVPVGVVVSAPERPQFGPNGTLASPSPSPEASR